MVEWQGHFDGACAENPGGPIGLGWTLQRLDPQNVVAEGAKHPTVDGEETNNVAEYMALLSLLDAVYEHVTDGDTVTVYGDSRLVVKQVMGDWGCDAENLKGLLRSAQVLVDAIPASVTLEHVPREHNVRADELSKAALP